MINLNDLTLDELQSALAEIGEPKFRAKQIFKWFARGVTRLEEMTDISAKTKEKIKENYNICNVEVWQRFDSKLDETKKFLMELDDGNIIETVAMFYKHGITVCISTQVGCNMGCKFCASTIGGKCRNLTAGEILGQVATVQRNLGTRISTIVLMGIGEPLDNYANVLNFLKNVNNENGMCIGYRHISLSTCGLVDKINTLAEENIPITLSVSLHAADNETRNK
ncbi:MAG: radical SAM protein, partial [Clostridia bacterium]|nr:radical SAM protein [Clostridia bacterium]